MATVILTILSPTVSKGISGFWAIAYLEKSRAHGTLSVGKNQFISIIHMGVIGFDGDQEVNEACRALGVS